MATRSHFRGGPQHAVVTASSPDRSVSMRLCPVDGLSVSVSNCALRLSEKSLGEQATIALQGIRRGYRRSLTSIVAAARGRADACPSEPGSPRRLTPRRRRLTARLERLSSHRRSPHGRVGVFMAADGRCAIQLAPGCLSRTVMSPSFLAEEIRAAVVDARDELERMRRDVVEAHRRTDSDLSPR